MSVTASNTIVRERRWLQCEKFKLLRICQADDQTQLDKILVTVIWHALYHEQFPFQARQERFEPLWLLDRMPLRQRRNA